MIGGPIDSLHHSNDASGGVLGGSIDSMGAPNTHPNDALHYSSGACIDSMGLPNTHPDDASGCCTGMRDRGMHPDE